MGRLLKQNSMMSIGFVCLQYNPTLIEEVWNMKLMFDKFSIKYDVKNGIISGEEKHTSSRAQVEFSNHKALWVGNMTLKGHYYVNN
jgi:hypothetical protein